MGRMKNFLASYDRYGNEELMEELEVEVKRLAGKTEEEWAKVDHLAYDAIIFTILERMQVSKEGKD